MYFSSKQIKVYVSNQADKNYSSLIFLNSNSLAYKLDIRSINPNHHYINKDMAEVTIVMYHYVRELSLSRYPDINGLSVKEFERQLDYFENNYQFITVEDCIASIYDRTSKIPENSLLLTFDDGYKEHFTEVFPILDQRGIQGAFFPPVQAISEHKVLDVNKIHFILASAEDNKNLVKALDDRIIDLTEDYNLEKPEHYFNKLGDSEHRYDPPEIIYFKRLLQRELPEEPRKMILDDLFKEFVGVEEEIFARELYMNEEQIKCMHRNGMFFGGHGYSHKWLNAISAKEQEFEVRKTRDFLDELGIQTDGWVMCYPYGAFDENLINILKEENCSLGISTEVGVAQLRRDTAFSLKRMDTNDFPPIR